MEKHINSSDIQESVKVVTLNEKSFTINNYIACPVCGEKMRTASFEMVAPYTSAQAETININGHSIVLRRYSEPHKVTYICCSCETEYFII